jgi:hypothetical protein
MCVAGSADGPIGYVAYWTVRQMAKGSEFNFVSAKISIDKVVPVLN